MIYLPFFLVWSNVGLRIVYQHPGGENKRPSPAIVDASLRDAIPLAERAAYGA